MKITFTENAKGEQPLFQARTEQSFSTGDGHGDFCLTAYGNSRDEAHANLRELSLKMVRDLERVRAS